MSRRLYFNGLEPQTGAYLRPPVRREELAAQLRRVAIAPPAVTKGEPKPGVDPADLASSGWGVLFPYDADECLREALRPLRDLRWSQATSEHQHYYKEYWRAEGYRPGDTKSRWLARAGAGPGPADPDKVPYHLLLVGGPEQIPFDFQLALSLQYGVGRLAFEDIEDYAAYAASLASRESSSARNRTSAALFGVRNPDDPPTRYCLEDLMLPVAEALGRQRPEWQLEERFGPMATKEALVGTLASEPPALLFTGSHGLGLPSVAESAPGELGSLVCSDWLGPKSPAGLDSDCIFGPSDIEEAGDLEGMIAFHFACFSLGSPQYDSFSLAEPREQLADRPYLARLPQTLLSHRLGAAAAVVGHVDRARGYSFHWPGAGAQSGAIEAVLLRLMDGLPVGTAARFLSERAADIATELAGSHPLSDEALVSLYTAWADARSYAVLGDPAARLAI